MADILFPLYLLALPLAPLLAVWRWGLVAALVIAVAELGLVVLVFVLFAPPNPYPVGGAGWLQGESPMLQLGRSREFSTLSAIAWLLTPGTAVLLGGGLAVVWSLVRAVRRSRQA